jgi:hypothetical protein
VASLKKLFGLSAFGALALAMLARSGVLASLFSANYLPHRYCYLAQSGLVWTNVASDGLIAISYAVIFSCLIWIARKLRDIPDIHGYLWIFLSFGLFIVAFTTKELGLGMGVGLSLSRAIAQDRWGSLTLRPHTEHTCFRLTLPIKGNDARDEEEQISIGVPYQPA